MAVYRTEAKKLGVLSSKPAWTAHYTDFMTARGKSVAKIPVMGYKELDLFRLYQEVIAFGGFQEVINNVGTWSKIWKSIPNYDPSITDSSYRLKKKLREIFVCV